MPSQPKPGYVPLHVFIPEELKRAIEMQAVKNKYDPQAGPATLTDIVITALRLYLTQQGVLGA
jgi:hypothetical protein